MKRFLVPCLVLLFLVGSTLPTHARTEGIVGSEDDIRMSVDYSYGEAKFERADGNSDGDTDLKQNYAGVRLETALSDDLQVYVSGGQTMNEFSDSDVEDGTMVGGGIQYVIEENDHNRYKLFGSYMEHSDEKFETNTNQSLEVVDDWQAGLMLSRVLNERNRFGTLKQSHAYITLLYSGRDVELSNNNSTTDFEYSEVGGFHISGGVEVIVEEGLSLELEAQAGSTLEGTARISTTF